MFYVDLGFLNLLIDNLQVIVPTPSTVIDLYRPVSPNTRSADGGQGTVEYSRSCIKCMTACLYSSFTALIYNDYNLFLNIYVQLCGHKQIISGSRKLNGTNLPRSNLSLHTFRPWCHISLSIQRLDLPNCESVSKCGDQLEKRWNNDQVYNCNSLLT